jgi:D-psicose/D-tagatose/L-ribulose 3-epimerase
MKYGMNMLLWTDDVMGEKFPPLFERLKKMGFDQVEVPVFKTDPGAFAALGRRLDGIGLERSAVTVLAPHQNLISPDAEARRNGVAHLKAVIDCCHACGVKMLVGPIYASLGVFSGRGPTPDEWAWSADGLRQAAEFGRQAGVTLVAEYLNRFEIYLLNCAADATRMVRDVGHPNFKMMYDTFHANIEEKNITEAIAGCKDVLAHVHVSENDRSTPGKGGVNWKETFAALKKVNYRGTLMIEAFGQGLPSLAAATKIWRRMFEDEEKLAREGLAFMKKMWEGSRAKKAGAAKKKTKRR